MPRARANGIEIEYDVTGDGGPLLLIMVAVDRAKVEAA